MTNFLAVRDGGKTNEEGAMRAVSKLLKVGGVYTSSDLAVTQHAGTPAMNVDIATGDIFIPYLTYIYHDWSDAVNTVTITSNSSGNPRIDAIAAWVDLSVVSSSSNNNPGAFKFIAVAGTPAVSPTAPSDSDIQSAIGASNPFLRLANVTVASGTSSIVNANISDQRLIMGIRSGSYVEVAEDSADPTSPSSGFQRLFIRSSDGLIYKKNSGGTVSGLVGMPLNGLIADPNTWTYSSVDGHTSVVTINADVTGYIQAGTRIKLTQTTDKWFIVSKTPTFGGGNSTLTLYGGTDYTVANAAITSPYYSYVKDPFGFNSDPAKWTEVVATVGTAQTSPTVNVWYNKGSSMDIPIGSWFVTFAGTMYGQKLTATSVSVESTLSTANNSESDVTFSSYFVVGQSTGNGTVTAGGSFYKSGHILLTSKTTYYANIRTETTGAGTISMTDADAGSQKIIIKAICGYL